MNSSGFSTPQSPCMVMVRDKSGSPDLILCIHGMQIGSKFPSEILFNERFVRPQIVCLWGLRCVREISPFQSTLSVNPCFKGRNQDYLNLNLNFTTNVVKTAIILRMFPKFLRPYAATSCHQSVSLNWSQGPCTPDIQPSIANSEERRIH